LTYCGGGLYRCCGKSLLFKEGLEKMKERIISAVIGIAIFLVALTAKSVVFDIAIIVLTATVIFEFYKAVGIIKDKILASSGAVGIILCPILGFAHMSDNNLFFEIALTLIVLYIGIVFALMVFLHETIDTKKASTAFFGALFPSVLYSYLIALRESEYGIFLIVALFAATWSADGGAYFAGVSFGKHLLAPKLSPKKTIEGAVGGIAGSVLAMAVYSLLLINVFSVPCKPLALLAAGLVCAVLGPLGDIATSAVKREFGIKDYGKILPGHGGALDRFDSILLTAPFIYILNDILKMIG
jgi:phosphatidate cytidylyltransferase